ncbi:hypothetical protein ACSMX9_22685 [Streptomyces sp. LE64]|uniref:hypothetical protein n=1 Tax=Streptomyces sp. LE64 TaxID=3448653 RepID=UPI004041F6B8
MSTPLGPGADHFTEASIRRAAWLEAARTAAEAALRFTTPAEFAAARGALEGLSDRFRRLADHYTTAEQPAGLTWAARADHAVHLYARTAIERDDARTEAARLRARIAELEQRDAWLTALESAGVDNWSGIDHALELHRSP